MSNATISGSVHFIGETQTFGQRGFRKRMVVLKLEDGNYENFIPLQFIQDRSDLPDTFSEGDQVQVAYRLSGRKWQRDPSAEVKYFLDAEALSVQVLDGSGGGGGFDAGDDPNQALAEAADEAMEDDIPF